MLVFWALRGGGAGSWGVVISATFRTYPFFNATLHTAAIIATTNASSGRLAEIHAQHIFDWDDMRAGQYFYFVAVPGVGNVLSISTYFANATAEQAAAAMEPFLAAVQEADFTIASVSNRTGIANDLLEFSDDFYGVNDVIGSRLIPAKAYESWKSIKKIGKAYAEMFEQGVPE